MNGLNRHMTGRGAQITYVHLGRAQQNFSLQYNLTCGSISMSKDEITQYIKPNSY